MAKTETIVEAAKRQGLNRFTAIVLVLLHIASIVALFRFSWKNLAIAVVFYYLTTGLGISMGYHRLHTHRSYKVPALAGIFLRACGTLTLEGGPIFWVAVHRLHHQLSDQPGDPHSPRDGALLGHMGWILWGETNHNNTRVMTQVRSGPGQAQVLCLAHQLSLGSDTWFSASSCWCSAACRCVLWAMCFRIVFGLHATWPVNSATHMFGSRRFAIRDDSRNIWWIALISFGEGWHNNHHAHPTSARHGLAWYEFDQSWLLIKALRAVGLARNVRVASVDAGLPKRSRVDYPLPSESEARVRIRAWAR